MSLVDNSYRSAFPAVPLNRATASGAAGAATPAAPGKPRPFLDGVFKTACNYCVSSKRGCSGGRPCDHCLKRGKTCVYAPRRKSGPRSRPASAAQLSKGRAKPKARRENHSAAPGAASPPPATQPGDEGRQAPWTDHSDRGDGYAVNGGNNGNTFVWEQRSQAYPHQHQRQRQPPLPGDREPPLPSMPRRDASGPIAGLRHMESSPPAGHQLQAPSPLAPVLPIRSVSAAAAGAVGGRGVDGNGRGHGSMPLLPRASSEDPAGNNKRTRLSLTPPPRCSHAPAPGGPSPPPLGSSSTPPPPPPCSLPTPFRSSSTSSWPLGGTQGGLMSRWQNAASSHSIHWVPGAVSGRITKQQGGGGPGLVPPVTAAPAAPIPPPTKGVLDRVPSFSGFGGSSGGDGSGGAAEGSLAASSWAAIAAMATSCVGEGRDEDELEASFGSMFPTEKQEEARLQLKLKVQQLRLEQKEQQLRQWQEQLEQQQQQQRQQQQQQQQQQQEERPSAKRELSLGTLLMDEDGEAGGGSSKHEHGEGRTSLSLVTAAPPMPVRAVSTESSIGGGSDDGGPTPSAASFAACRSSASTTGGIGEPSGGTGLPPPPDGGDQAPFSRVRSASEGSSAGRLLSSGQLHSRQDLPRAVSIDHGHVHGGDAAVRGPFGGGGSGGVADMPAPVKREPSFLRDAASSSSSSSFSSAGGSGGGDDDEEMTDGALGIADGDMRENLSREESLRRAIEAVNARTGGGNGDVDCEEAAAELIASVGLGDMTAVAVW